MTNKKQRNRIPKLLSFIFFVAFGMSFFFIELSFALKPYMLAVLLIFTYLLYQALRRNVKVHRLLAYEYIFIAFLLVVGVSMFYSLYPERSFRLSVNTALIGFCYVVLRTFFLNFLSLDDLKQSVGHAGAVIAVASLAFYAIGAYSLGFNFTGNSIDSYGLTVDRGTPRLMGVVTTDPNLTAAFLSVFFFFLLASKGKLLTKLLIALTIILTFSRGAYLAIASSLLIHVVTNARQVLTSKMLRLAAAVVAISIVAFGALNNLAGINVTDLATSRVDDASVDGGSGRIDIWEKALGAFSDHPVLGIGANSSLQYNIDNFGEYHYVHNTYIEVLVELGMIGAMIYLLLIILIFYACVACYKKKEYAPLLIFIALLIQMSFLSMMTNEAFLVALLILTASIHSIRKMDKHLNNENDTRRKLYEK